MKLLVKFNLIFVLVFALGLVLSALVARHLLQQSAQQDAAERARLLLADANVVSAYTATQIGPLLETQIKYRFLPQSVPSYSAAEVVAGLQKSYPDYSFKSAMLNPTNPRDRAVAWEEDVIAQFGRSPALTEIVGHRATPGGEALYIARPIRISDGACLVCHSTPDAAPRTLIDRYGPSNGFGWKLGDTLGIQVVSVPMAVALQRADQALVLVVGLLSAVFLLVGAALNSMLWKLVVRPVSRLSTLADRVSLGELDAPEFETGSKDEIGVLSASFGRMRKSLAHAMKLLEG